MADPEKINELLKADLAEAKKCKVRATPTILINGLKMTNRTLQGYQSRINQILKQEVAAGEFFVEKTVAIHTGEHTHSRIGSSDAYN